MTWTRSAFCACSVIPIERFAARRAMVASAIVIITIANVTVSTIAVTLTIVTVVAILLFQRLAGLVSKHSWQCLLTSEDPMLMQAIVAMVVVVPPYIHATLCAVVVFVVWTSIRVASILFESLLLCLRHLRIIV